MKLRLPDVPPERALAAVVATVLMAVIIGWLVAQPDLPTGRVISVDADGDVTD